MAFRRKVIDLADVIVTQDRGHEILIIDVIDISLDPRLLPGWDQVLVMRHTKRKIIDVVDENVRILGEMLQQANPDEAKSTCYENVLHQSPVIKFAVPIRPVTCRPAKRRSQ